MHGAITCWAVANVNTNPKSDSSTSARGGLPILHLLWDYSLLQANITVTQALVLQRYGVKNCYQRNGLQGVNNGVHIAQLSQELCIARTILYCRGKIASPYCSLGDGPQRCGRASGPLPSSWERRYCFSEPHSFITPACSYGVITTHITMLRGNQD